MLNLFLNKKIEMSKSAEKNLTVEEALEEYRLLLICGCGKFPCERCSYIREVGNRYKCKRTDLMKILWPKHKDDVLKIDEEVRKRGEL